VPQLSKERERAVGQKEKEETYWICVFVVAVVVRLVAFSAI
jgi:hypothetical protein